MAQERILVVDDETAVRRIVAALLDRGGYHAVVASGAEEALQRLKEDAEFDLVLSDVMMPEVDGLSLLDRIVVDYPGTPVVMFTAVHDIHVATNAFRRGAIDYLLKPFERVQLMHVVTRAVEHGRLRKQNVAYRLNLEEIVLARTGRLRDAETEGHSKRVTAYAIALAREMGLNAEELKVIARGAFLHDIGKIATPDEVLLKPGKLDAREMAIMREHCERGYEMVRKIPFLQQASEIVYSHQESFDGSGYPRGLQGAQIPLGARIFAIADTLDAITSDRPYRRGRSFAEARDEIARCSGRQFDPVIVEVFLRVPLERWSELRAEITRMAPAVVSATLCRPVVEMQVVQ
jgi:putative nucleotidyltransferase with HDIG domain